MILNRNQIVSQLRKCIRKANKAKTLQEASAYLNGKLFMLYKYTEGEVQEVINGCIDMLDEHYGSPDTNELEATVSYVCGELDTLVYCIINGIVNI